jgi:predicted AlkP superfamily pyrophosphatase or phosphodiesterase
MSKLIRVVLAALWLPLAAPACRSGEPVGAAQPSAPATLVLVAFDGWRWDYASHADTPHLDALAARGVSAERLIPVFPSKTFPNHHTIVTGLYPEHHGVVSNTMDDPAIGERFTLSSPTARDPRWWGGEPLWNTVERQGKRAASMFWPGSDVAIGGRRPTWWFEYDGSVPNATRVRQVLEWMKLAPGERPAFITLYFSEVDSAGHEHGPLSEQVRAAVRRVDGLLGDLVAGIDALGVLDETIIAIVSDHGMSQLSPDRVILLDEYINLSTVSIIEWSPVLGITPRRGSPATVVKTLSGRHPSLRVYAREDVPEALHHSEHPRIPPVVGIAADGWTITSRSRVDEQRRRGDLDGGAHGYASSDRSMHGIFVAAGPGLRQGLRLPPFENVHLYELFCALLGLTPAPNDGDRVALEAMLDN